MRNLHVFFHFSFKYRPTTDNLYRPNWYLRELHVKDVHSSHFSHGAARSVPIISPLCSQNFLLKRHSYFFFADLFIFLNRFHLLRFGFIKFTSTYFLLGSTRASVKSASLFGVDSNFSCSRGLLIRIYTIFFYHLIFYQSGFSFG